MLNRGVCGRLLCRGVDSMGELQPNMWFGGAAARSRVVTIQAQGAGA